MKKIPSGEIAVVSFENHKLPDFVERKGKDWVYYGEDNLYPDYLINLFTRDAYNNAIITGKTGFIYGKGLAVEGKQPSPKAEVWLQRANPAETWNDVIAKCILDIELFNGIAIEVIWGNGKPLEYYHIDFGKVRSNKDSTEFYYCEDWKKSQPQKEESFKVYKPYDSASGSGSQLFYYKAYRPSLSQNSNVYPLPDYVGCVADIETDVEVTNFHFNNVKHGFSAGTMVNFNNGTPTQEKIDSITKKFKGKFTGTDKSGNVILTFNDSKDREATVVSLQPNNLDKQFEILSLRLQQNIFSGHKVTTPMLFGIKTTGQLGGRAELLDGWELFKNTYVLNRRDIVERIVNEFAVLSGIPTLILLELDPIGITFSESTIATVLTPDEIRARLGYEAKPLPTIPAQPALQRKFSKEDDEKLIKLFKNCGTPADQFIVLREKRFNFSAMNEVVQSENEMLKQYFANPLTIEIDKLDKKILEIIKKDPLISVKDIAKALKVSVKDVSNTINSLVDSGALKTKEAIINEEPTIERTLTDNGNTAIQESPIKVIDISLVYQYKVAPTWCANHPNYTYIL